MRSGSNTKLQTRVPADKKNVFSDIFEITLILYPGANKPFAAYWATALFQKQLGENNGDYKALIGFESEQPTVTPTPAPAQ